MTENKQRKPMKALKVAGVIAAALAVMVMTVSAAAPQVVEPIITKVMNILSIEKINDYQDKVVMEGGYEAISTKMPSFKVENRDGKAILVVEDIEEVDITDALANDGVYNYEKALTEDLTLKAKVEGSIDSWTIRATSDAIDGMDYTVLYTSGDQAPVIEDFTPDITLDLTAGG